MPAGDRRAGALRRLSRGGVTERGERVAVGTGSHEHRAGRYAARAAYFIERLQQRVDALGGAQFADIDEIRCVGGGRDGLCLCSADAVEHDAFQAARAADVEAASDAVVAKLGANGDLLNVKSDLVKAGRQVEITVDASRAAAVGLSAAQVAGEVRNFDAKAWMDPKAIRRSEPAMWYGVAASKQALADAGVTLLGEVGLGGVKLWRRLGAARAGSSEPRAAASGPKAERQAPSTSCAQ